MILVFQTSSPGSSPRVRGTPEDHSIGRTGCRFIPAGAGNTKPTGTSVRSASVHPRGCGEHFSVASQPLEHDGSSPRVRGTRYGMRTKLGQERFIPAGAGNTLTKQRWRFRRAVHPRGCGEHGLDALSILSQAGSSPRVRGTRNYCARYRWQFRFIPAGAGNTAIIKFENGEQPVHPRGCGEHSCPNWQ